MQRHEFFSQAVFTAQQHVKSLPRRPAKGSMQACMRGCDCLDVLQEACLYTACSGYSDFAPKQTVLALPAGGRSGCCATGPRHGHWCL